MAKSSLGYVYFLLSPVNQLVKIGYSKEHPKGRFRRLRATSPVPLDTIAIMRGTQTTESDLHQKFLSLWSHGEWFHVDESLLGHIDEIAKSWTEIPPVFRPPKVFTTREQRIAILHEKAEQTRERLAKPERERLAQETYLERKFEERAEREHYAEARDAVLAWLAEQNEIKECRRIARENRKPRQIPLPPSVVGWRSYDED
jgi:hypothetical protein